MREDAFNEVLAEERRRRRYWEDNPETIACQRLRLVEDTREQIDILVQSPDSYLVAVEAEWRDPALTDARQRLGEMRMERDFDIHALLTDRAAWAEFMNELFHHALRIAPEVGTPEERADR